MGQEGIEQRKFIRFPFKYEVFHRVTGNKEWQKSASNNISLGGIMFMSARGYSLRDKLELKINYPECENENIIIIPAIVIWASKMYDEQSTYLIGLQFKDLSKEQETYINSLIHSCAVIQKEKQTFKKKKILIVEDEKTLRELIAVCLREKEYTVFVAENGKNAISSCRENKPDLIILDVNLPDILGIEIAEIISASRTEFGSPKIIVLTAISYSIDDAKERWMKEFDFVVDFVTKPFKYEDLINKIEANLK